MSSKEILELIEIKNNDDWVLLGERYKSIEEMDVYRVILVYLKQNYEVKSVVIENNYIDQEYRNEYSNFYSKVFKKHDSFSKRLHFFEKSITTLEEIKNNESKELGYLGFVTLRPLDIGHVSKTIIKPLTEKNRDYILCTASFKSHILGNEFIIEASPFIQQDRMVMCCAHASLWMIARYMSNRHGFSVQLPYQINEKTSKAVTAIDRAIPADKGIYLESICNALSNMGYYPVVFGRTSYCDPELTWEPVSHIYKYIESKIPVIVTIPGHAFVVVGHTFNYSPEFKNQEGQSIIDNKAWIDSFIVNDDARGPYKIMPTQKDNIEIFEWDEKKKERLSRDDEGVITAEKIDFIVVPLLEKIYLRGEYVDLLVKTNIKKSKYLNAVSKQAENGNKYSKEFLDCLSGKDNPIVLRTYFLSSQEFKMSLLKRYKNVKDTLNKKVIDDYIKMEMPHYIWLTEISSKNRISQKEESDRTIFGEVIIDTTENRYIVDSYLAIHLPGVLITKDPGKEGFMFPIENDTPYSQHPRINL